MIFQGFKECIVKMIDLSSLFVSIFGGYSSQKEQDLIEQSKGEYHLQSIVKNEILLNEILEQAVSIRSLRD